MSDLQKKNESLSWQKRFLIFGFLWLLPSQNNIQWQQMLNSRMIYSNNKWNSDFKEWNSDWTKNLFLNIINRKEKVVKSSIWLYFISFYTKKKDDRLSCLTIFLFQKKNYFHKTTFEFYKWNQCCFMKMAIAKVLIFFFVAFLFRIVCYSCFVLLQDK